MNGSMTASWMAGIAAALVVVPTPGSGAATAPGAAAKASAPAAASGADPFPLSRGCFNGNGTFNHENIVSEQKKRAPIIGDKLGSRYGVSETPHYLIFSNTDPQVTQAFLEWAEPLYANLQRQLGIDPKERVWDGKCIVLVFNARQEFLEYATQFDKMDARRWNAYYAAESRGRGYPLLIHLCFPAGGRNLAALQNYFAHEGTHAFFRTYKGGVRLPLWLEEGLGEYMMVQNDPALRTAKRAPAEAAARSGKDIGDVLEYPSTTVLTPEEYSVCYTLADFLLSTSGPRTGDFVLALKRRVPQGSAIQTSFGFSLSGLQDRWRAGLTGGSAPARQPHRSS